MSATKHKDLRADHVDDWLDGLTSKLSTRSLQGIHSILKRAIRQAQARDKVLRNVAELVTTPKGKAGRPSKGSDARSGHGRAQERQSLTAQCLRRAQPHAIADLVGHAGTAVTEKVYRHQLKPVITSARPVGSHLAS